MRVRTNKIILERDNQGYITVNVYASKQVDVTYTTKDGMERVDSIWQSETSVFPLLSNFHEKEFFNRIADAVDSIDDKNNT